MKEYKSKRKSQAKTTTEKKFCATYRKSKQTPKARHPQPKKNFLLPLDKRYFLGYNSNRKLMRAVTTYEPQKNGLGQKRLQPISESNKEKKYSTAREGKPIRT